MMYTDNEYKWVAVLNRTVTLPQLLNAMGHLALGMPRQCQEETAGLFHSYEDSDRRLMSTISHWPVIVLQAKNSNQLRSLRSAAVAACLTCQAFADTMIGRSAEDQMQKTKTTDEKNIEYFAVFLFGKNDDVQGLTKKFSVFTQPRVESQCQGLDSLDPS